ncbi:MAG TPA: hypothetical protein VN038_01425 [Dyadobacter sp.]|nr:hypothetical protein [Dyadobacter sp.]
MSLRLDPKYHGVRVARVRPKRHIITRSQKVYEFWRGYIEISEYVTLYFVMNDRKKWIVPEMQYAARVNGDYYYGQKEALEALGLR